MGATKEVDTKSLSKEMSEIGLKDTKLIKLKQKIEELEKERVKRNRVEKVPKKNAEN